MSAALFAAPAAAVAVPAAWELLRALEPARLPAAALHALAPLARARSEGRDPTAPEQRRLALLGMLALLLAGWLLAGPLAGAVLALGGPWLALLAVRTRRRRWQGELGRSAPALARVIADAVGAGHAVRGALVVAARERGLPIAAAAELRILSERLALGDPTEAVLDRLRARANSREIDVVVAAILLQRDAGGDLAGLLRDLATAQEEAERLERDARSATAQARFTGLIVCLLPVGAALLGELASPGLLGGLLAAPLTTAMLVVAAVLQGLSLVLIRRIAAVRT